MFERHRLYGWRGLRAVQESTKPEGGPRVLPTPVELSVIPGHLAARLDAVYEKACKGVHNEVDNGEAQLTVIHTYLFLAEVARHTAPAPLKAKDPRKDPAAK